MPRRRPEIQIEDGIPIPPKSRADKWPFAKLAVGQSFLMPGLKKAPPYIYKWRKLTGFKFEPRILSDGVRIWRTA